MTRWTAATIHLSISISVGGVAAALLYFVWFPSPWFVAAGASTLVLTLMCVDIGLGPLLTAIVFNKQKGTRALGFDLIVVAILQLTAFMYGAYVIWQARPVFVVGEVDRLVLVSAEEISEADLAQAALPAAKRFSVHGPILVGAEMPASVDAFDIVANALRSGKDIDRLPQLYVPYAQVSTALLKHSFDLHALRGLKPSQKSRLGQLRARAAEGGYQVAGLPVQRRDEFYTAVVRVDDAMPLAVLAIDPWDAGAL